jgi:50S ribosomal protein L16 3-hydroxylase
MLHLPVSVETFMAEYWQRQPLLMRRALDPGLFTVAPDELAGLACEPEIESRLVIQRGDTDWQVEHGPFDEAVFAGLPPTRWTLLVQDVDKFRADVAALIDHFGLIPRWRIDDIMISYASDQGGVGPHLDAYDVFLMQGLGRRRWRISLRPDGGAVLPDLDLRILARFETDEDWILEPGDVLYLPPGVGHWGTADGDDCMTYSLGLRAPTRQELLSDWLTHVLDTGPETGPLVERAEYRPPAGRLADGTLQAASTLCAEATPNGPRFERWLGAFLTEPKPHFRIDPPEAPWDNDRLEAWLAGGGRLVHHPALRACWRGAGDDRAILFCHGEAIDCAGISGKTLDALCTQRCLSAEHLGPLSPPTRALVLKLLNAGYLEPEDPDWT